MPENNCKMLIEAIYWQAIKDVVAEWRYAEKHNAHRYSRDYQTAITFLKSSEKGQRILRLLQNCDEEQRAKLIKMGMTILTGGDYETKA